MTSPVGNVFSRPLTPEIRYALIILLVGIALRTVALGTNPPGMFRDEAEKVYTAWSLATTGGYHHLVQATGPNGMPMPAFERLGPPFFVDAYGSWTSSIYQWLDAPFALLLGPTMLAARLPAAIAGVLTLLLVWGYARRAFDPEIALLALFFVAISPWHVLFSRWALQGILVPLWLALGLWAFERGRTAAGRGWWLAGAALGVALFTYAPMRMIIPLMLVALLVVHRADFLRNRRGSLVFLITFVVVSLPTVLWLLMHRQEGLQRFSNVSIFQEDASIGEVVTQFLTNWLSHFSFPFLFFSGDANPRHSLPGFGQLHWIELPGLIIGLLVALLYRRPQDLLLAVWLFIAPLAASLTLETPHALRSIAALPAIHILSALGTATLFRGMVRWAHETLPNRWKRLTGLQQWVRFNTEGLRMTGLVLGGGTAILIGLQLFLRAPHLTAEAWDTGLHEAIREVAPLAEAGHPVFVSGTVLYLPTQLRVALEIPPRSLGRVAPFLPAGWNQTGEGPVSPAALWDRMGGDSGGAVFITRPGEIPTRMPEYEISSPSNRFTGDERILWDIHMGQQAQGR